MQFKGEFYSFKDEIERFYSKLFPIVLLSYLYLVMLLVKGFVEGRC